jgi:hypothetical protein
MIHLLAVNSYAAFDSTPAYPRAVGRIYSITDGMGNQKQVYHVEEE